MVYLRVIHQGDGQRRVGQLARTINVTHFIFNIECAIISGIADMNCIIILEFTRVRAQKNDPQINRKTDVINTFQLY